ncbi:ATP synthase F0 subunit B [Edaphobacter sp.]|uniref:ATP synthase F0 subunit B n=1 Tax=Edaphobacter sp. TaxID=1934404 RepID=UPI002DBE5792|nr:ATP synthase F0 subunit B [Edaphobacter sp.]HEU5340369.1 ATP synthase F0 subunit B [Edaphobacter sp.]
MSLLRIKRLLPVLVMAGAMFVSVPQVRAQAPATATSVDSGDRSTPEAQSPDKNKQEENENEAYRHSAMVRFLGAKLGLNAEQAATAFSLFNFALLVIGVGWVLLKTLPKMFRDRSSAIQKHLVDARTATAEASARLSSVEERLAKLDGQIAAMRSQAEKDAVLDEQRIKAAVEDEKRKILDAAEQEIASATVQARREIQQYAADLAIDQAAKKLVVTAETDRLLVQNFARRLTGTDAKEGHN